MFSNLFEIIILSAIQGITEFLPISSSAHLILVNKISNLQIGSLYLDTGMHLGSLLAIIFFFRNDLIKILDDKKLFTATSPPLPKYWRTQYQYPCRLKLAIGDLPRI